MKTLKVPLVFLLIYLGIVFNIEVLAINADYVLVLHRFVDVLILVIVVAGLLVRDFHKLPAYAQHFFWVIVYYGMWFLSNKSANVQINILVTGIEVTLVVLASMFTWAVAERLFNVEDTYEKLVFASFPGRTLNMSESAEEIQTEVLRSRRYQRALTVIVLEPDPVMVRKATVAALEDIQESLAKRYMMAQLSRAINAIARRPDLVIKTDQSDRFVLLCPETDAERSEILRQRILSEVKTSLGITMSVGSASFPDDAVTFEELLDKASSRLTPLSPSSLPVIRMDEADTQNL